jgi:hypothetical protein
MMRFDVAVVGGGPAGIAAALCAAVRGARTVLLEREPTLGGNVANAYVHTICGLYSVDAAGNCEFVNPGFPARLARALAAGGGAGAPERVGRVAVLPIDPAAFAAHLEGERRGVPNLSCVLRAPLRSADLAVTDGGSSFLTYEHQGLRCELEAGVVIDASGDGDVAALGQASFALSPGGELQAISFIFEVMGVVAGSFSGFSRLQLSALCARAARAGDLPAGCESVLVRPGRAPDRVYVTLNLPNERGAARDLLDPRQLGELRAEAAARAVALLAFLRAAHPAFARADAGAWPRRVGVRETRRLVGEHVITEDEILEGRRCQDEVALSSWPIELWVDHRRAHFSYPTGPSGIPLGALRSRSHPELAMAGRCLSATHAALGSLRVIGTALATGEAAGVAAALACDSRRSLRAVGASAVRASIDATAERGLS